MSARRDPSDHPPATAPPRVAERLFAGLLPPDLRDPALGDLVEEMETRAEEGASRASLRRWYWKQLFISFSPLLANRLRRRRRARAHPSGDSSMHMLAQDLGYALRQLRRAPGFSLLIVLTLALGIGANTLIYSVVDGVVLNPFPYPEPERLVGVGAAFPRTGRELSFWEVLSPAEYLDVKAQSRTLDRVVAWDMGQRGVSFGDRTENLFSAFWWGDAFQTLGVQPELGRGFLPEEMEQPSPVAILSHRIWTSAFGADSTLVGGTILVNGNPHTVVGIMPPRTLVYGTDLWLTMGVSPSVFPRERRQFQLLGRVAQGATLEEANAELATIAGAVQQTHGAELEEYEGWALEAVPWTDVNVRMVKPAALLLMGAVGFVLLLVCANVASLLLARAASRRQEIAVRTALGAHRSRIVRQLLTESTLLALIGGAAGVGLAWVGADALVGALAGLALPFPGEVAVNGRVLAFTLAVSLTSGVLFGLIPALHALRGDVRGGLTATASDGGHGRLRLQRGLVAAEVAVALVLLVGGGLLVHSFARLSAVDPGVQDNVLTLRLTLPWNRYDEPAIQRFFRELEEEVGRLPGVESAAVSTQFPPGLFSQRQFWIEGTELGREGTLPIAYVTTASPAYFETLGIPVLSGRSLAETDLPGGPFAVVMNEAAARRYFPAGDAVGRRMKAGGPDSDSPWVEVVGVVADTRNVGPEREPAPELFLSVWQAGGGNQLFVLLRTSVEPYSLLPAVREAVRALDPAQPVYAIRTVGDAFSAASLPQRIATVAMAVLALFALVLAVVGIYGVVSYAAAQRTREIGIRMALGARSGSVRKMVVRQALIPVAVGGACGLATALALGRLMRGILFEVSPTDPATVGGVTVLFVGIAFLASWIPARRASLLEPVRALREGGAR